MKPVVSLMLALLLALTACGGGGGQSNTSNSGLTPLDFDVTTTESSTVDGDTVIGYAVEMVNPMYAKAAASVPADEELVALLVFEPATPPGAGFEGDFTVRTTDRSASKVASAASGFVYHGIWDSRSQVWDAFRTGIFDQITDGTFGFNLDFLGIVMLTKPRGDQFQVAAFADLAQAQVDTEINFWAVATGGNEPLTFEWTFGDGATATGDQVSHVYPVLGEYNVTLTARDAVGNIAPVASTPISIVANPVTLTEVDVVVTPDGEGGFRFSATLNGGTPPFEYQWDFDGDGEVDDTSGPNPTFTPSTPGVYVFELVVSDQTGAEASESGILDARRITLDVMPNPAYNDTDVEFTVTTEGTNDDDSIEINYGDGTTGNETIRQYSVPGIYTVQASVSRLVNGELVVLTSEPVALEIEPRPAPRIDSVTPGRGTVGTQLTIAGEFFFIPETEDEVLLNDLPMPVVSWEPDQIVVTVPQGARDGDIIVHKALGDQDSNPIPFDVAPGTPGQPGLGQL